MHFVYIVRCADGTLYTGYSRDPRAREQAHNSSRGAKYTAGRRPVRLVYQEAFRSVGKALAREYLVKQLTRAQKDGWSSARETPPLNQHFQSTSEANCCGGIGAHTFGWVLNSPLRR